jgi:hypothetical protein
MRYYLAMMIPSYVCTVNRAISTTPLVVHLSSNPSVRRTMLHMRYYLARMMINHFNYHYVIPYMRYYLARMMINHFNYHYVIPYNNNHYSTTQTNINHNSNHTSTDPTTANRIMFSLMHSNHTTTN